MFSVKVPFEADQLPHRGELQYPPRLDNTDHFVSVTIYYKPVRQALTFVWYLSRLADHNELQHRLVISPGIDLGQVVQVRRQRTQIPLENTSFINQVLKCLRETNEITAVRTRIVQ